jgi:hypothetical protein
LDNVAFINVDTIIADDITKVIIKSADHDNRKSRFRMNACSLRALNPQLLSARNLNGLRRCKADGSNGCVTKRG